jgi:tRNA G18 (ribose-2'-O)-methylase SpoU
MLIQKRKSYIIFALKNEKKMQKKSMEALERLSKGAFKNTEKTPLVVILDNVRSALNVGSAFRTADAFALHAIALCGISAQPPHREILKTALGAEQSVDWQYFPETKDAVTHFRNIGFYICAIEQAEGSILLQNFVWGDKPICIVFGNEVDGVSEEVLNMSDACIEIPQFGTKHSLNISVSMGIVIWELYRKLKL